MESAHRTGQCVDHGRDGKKRATTRWKTEPRDQSHLILHHNCNIDHSVDGTARACHQRYHMCISDAGHPLGKQAGLSEKLNSATSQGTLTAKPVEKRMQCAHRGTPTTKQVETHTPSIQRGTPTTKQAQQLEKNTHGQRETPTSCRNLHTQYQSANHAAKH